MYPVHLVQLRTFVAVAEEQNLTRAAERLHLSLSAASAHIRAVEQMLGMELFVRTNRNLELSAKGQVLLEKAKLLLNHAATFASFARALDGQACGRVAVSSTVDPADGRMGAIVAALREHHPLVTLEVHARHTTGARQGLKTGELDVAIFLGKPIDPSLEYLVLSLVKYRVAGPPGWKQRIHEANWAELAALPWIAFTDRTMAYSQMLDRMFTERGLESNVVARTDNHLQSRAMVLAGVGVTLMREERALEGERSGEVAVSPIASAEIELVAANVASRKDDPLIQAVMGAVRMAWPEAKPVPSRATPGS